MKAWNQAGPFSTSFPVTVTSGASCTSTTNRTVHICSPTNGSTAGSPVNISAAASSTTFKALQVYIDGTLRTTLSTASINQNYVLALGAHTIVVKGWDAVGAFSSAITITVH